LSGRFPTSSALLHSQEITEVTFLVKSALEMSAQTTASSK
jgi:hypothetical protein